MRGEFRGKLRTIGREFLHEIGRNSTGKLAVRLRRAIALRPKVADFVFQLHEEHGLLRGVLFAKMRHERGECAAVATEGFCAEGGENLERRTIGSERTRETRCV